MLAQKYEGKAGTKEISYMDVSSKLVGIQGGDKQKQLDMMRTTHQALFKIRGDMARAQEAWI